MNLNYQLLVTEPILTNLDNIKEYYLSIFFRRQQIVASLLHVSFELFRVFIGTTCVVWDQEATPRLKAFLKYDHNIKGICQFLTKIKLYEKMTYISRLTISSFKNLQESLLKTCSLRKIVWISLVCPWCGEWCPDCTQHQRSFQDKLSSWRPLPRTGPVIQSKLLQCKTVFMISKKNEIENFFFTFLKFFIYIVSFMDSQFYVVWILLHQLLRHFCTPSKTLTIKNHKIKFH